MHAAMILKKVINSIKWEENLCLHTSSNNSIHSSDLPACLFSDSRAQVLQIFTQKRQLCRHTCAVSCCSKSFRSFYPGIWEDVICKQRHVYFIVKIRSQYVLIHRLLTIGVTGSLHRLAHKKDYDSAICRIKIWNNCNRIKR